MAVSVSKSGTGSSFAPNATTNGYLYYCHFTEQSGTNHTITSATFGGEDMTLVGQDGLAGNQLNYSIWRLNQAGLDSQSGDNFAPTFNPSTPSNPQYFAIQFEDVEQAAPQTEIQVISDTNSAPSPLPTIAALGDGMIVEWVASGTGATWTWVDYTSQQDLSPSGFDGAMATRATATSDVYDTEYDASSANRSFMVAVSINAVGTVGLTVDDIDTDDDVYPGQTNITVNGAIFESVQGTGVITLSPTDNIADSDATVISAVDSWSDTAIQFDLSDTVALPYGTNYLFVTNDSADSNANGHMFTLSSPAGREDFVIQSTTAQDTNTGFSIFKDLTSVVTGTDQCDYKQATVGGNGAVYVTHAGIAEVSYASTPPAGDSFEYRLWDSDSAVWTAFTTVTFNAINLSATTASITLTANNASLSLDSTLVTDSGTYTYGGTDLALVTTRTLALDSGSYTYAGQDVTFPTGFRLEMDSGSYTYTGAINFVLNLVKILDSGSYVYSGSDLALKGTTIVAMDSGAYTYTGAAADLSKNFAILADSGTYAYTGTDIAFPIGNIILADSGTYTYNGTIIEFESGDVLWTKQEDSSTVWEIQ